MEHLTARAQRVQPRGVVGLIALLLLALVAAGCGFSGSSMGSGMRSAATGLAGNWVTYSSLFGEGKEATGAFVIKADGTYSHFTFMNGKPDPDSRFSGPITPVTGYSGTYIFEDKVLFPGTKYTVKLRGNTLSIEISRSYVEKYEKVSRLP
ncbi:MAG TPA: hypothetical protein VHU91_08200 [Mycobacteriales bacterium]|jgi:hypothetical protein|nr:hypothetical protein [Mycobacteriales bacterium]